MHLKSVQLKYIHTKKKKAIRISIANRAQPLPRHSVSWAVVPMTQWTLNCEQTDRNDENITFAIPFRMCLVNKKQFPYRLLPVHCLGPVTCNGAIGVGLRGDGDFFRRHCMLGYYYLAGQRERTDTHL